MAFADDALFSRSKEDAHAPTLIVATVTSRTEKKKYQPTHVLIAHNTAFEKPSVVQLEPDIHDRQKPRTVLLRAAYAG